MRALKMFWHVITALLMERSLTYSDHSTTATTHYFTRSPHKSYGPMTQLLPGPQCHTCPNQFTSNFSLFLHPSLPSPFHPLSSFPPSFHACSLCLFQHPPDSYTSLCSFSHPHACYLFVSLLISFLHLCIHVCHPLSFLMLRFCITYASSANPFLSCSGSCPLHVLWGWTFEGSSRHLSLSTTLRLNSASNGSIIPWNYSWKTLYRASLLHKEVSFYVLGLKIFTRHQTHLENDIIIIEHNFMGSHSYILVLFLLPTPYSSIWPGHVGFLKTQWRFCLEFVLWQLSQTDPF